MNNAQEKLLKSAYQNLASADVTLDLLAEQLRYLPEGRRQAAEEMLADAALKCGLAKATLNAALGGK